MGRIIVFVQRGESGNPFIDMLAELLTFNLFHPF